jgi:hypothetical protein
MFSEPLDPEDVDFDVADSTICELPAEPFPEPLDKEDAVED